MKMHAFSILAVLTLLLAGADVKDYTPSTGTLTGVVRDADTMNPLPGASVVVVGTTIGTLTDRNGHYELPGVPAGKNPIQASFIGYQTLTSQDVYVCEGCTIELNFTLQSGVELDERIVEYERPLLQADAIQGIPATKRQRLTGFAAEAVPGVYSGWRDGRFNTEEYAYIEESGFLSPRMNPLSTFSIDVDAASYSNMRRFIQSGSRPPIDAIRTEELVNYFDYDYPHPNGEHPVEIYTELGRAPWNPDHMLLHVGLQAEALSSEDLRPSNLVFLIDVSGSMDSPDKLGLLKTSFKLLTQKLTENDRVALVVYAGAAGLVLDSTPGSDTERIDAAIDRLRAGGSTAGGAGIQLAYSVAQQNLIPDGNNRVILATDGDFNVGVSATGDLVRLVEEGKKDGIGLTVLGFGTGNLKDSRMESLADKGDGNYFYIDSILEGKKVFVDGLRSTLYTVAKDVKVQVEFNPAVVGSYRLLGYENRALNAEDFEDDTRDAGEMGSGHTVTALYEIVPALDLGTNDGPLRYQQTSLPDRYADELGIVKVRYKTPHGTRSAELDGVVRNSIVARPTDDFNFAASVAMFSMLLRDSDYVGTATPEAIVELARSAKGPDSFGYRSEFIRLVETWGTMDVADASVGVMRRLRR